MMTDTYLDAATMILVVDDDPLCRTMIRHMLEPDDVVVIETESIAKTWEVLKENSLVNFDVILLDRNLPDGDGIELLPRLRELPGLKHVPVIIQSGLASSVDVTKGMAAGAYHYLEKPYRRDMLRALTQIAVREGRERRFLTSKIEKANDALGFMRNSNFEIKTLDDARVLTPFLARLFPEPENASVGIVELLINAIEHGNLEISYECKSKLLEQNNWLNETTRRLSLPAYRDRKVHIHLEQHPERIALTIRDEGMGFDWRGFETLSEDRLFDLHGRGIALAKNAFDGLTYSSPGNVVTCWSAL
jgi:DNA-binding response OmpR family regulator